MALSLAGWANICEPILKKYFVDRYKLYKSLLPEFFTIQTSTKKTETFLGINGMGDFEEFQGVIESGVQPSEGYKQTVSHTEWAKKIEIARSLYKDDQYGIMRKFMSDMAVSARRTKEKNGFQLFNHFFDTTYMTVGDGLAVGSTAHVSSVSGVANQSNVGTSALTYDSYVAARTAMKNFVDDNGEVIDIEPNLLLVPTGLGETAIVITESQLKNVDNEVSAINKMWKPRVIETPRLSDTNNWWLIDQMAMKDACYWLDREPLDVFKDSSTTTLVLTMAGYYRGSKVATDWRWAYGNQVA